MKRWIVDPPLTNHHSPPTNHLLTKIFMSKVMNFKELRIWQQAMDLTKTVYILMREMPKEELYGLTNQIKRAAVSIPSNIAEGQAKGTKEFIHYLTIAKGSLSELETQLILTTRLHMIPEEKIQPILMEVESLHRQINSLKNRLQPPTTHQSPPTIHHPPPTIH